jgi:hypothetical protein
MEPRQRQRESPTSPRAKRRFHFQFLSAAENRSGRDCRPPSTTPSMPPYQKHYSIWSALVKEEEKNSFFGGKEKNATLNYYKIKA